MAGIDIVTLTLAKKYTEESLLGAGALKGKDGKDGADGQDGKDGDDGANGKSAYEIAVDNGFQGTEEEWLESLKVSGEIEYPSYAKNEMDSVLSRLDGLIWSIENPIIIGFNTDQHINVSSTSSSTKKTVEDVLYGVKTLRDITKKVPFNMVVLGGDASSSSTSVTTVQKDVLAVSEAIYGANAPIIHMVGNHDGYQNANTITALDVYKSHLTAPYYNKTVTPANASSINCYYDDITASVRFIFLQTQSVGIYNRDSAKTFLSSALSTLPNGYEAIIFSHHPLNSELPQNQARTLWNEPFACETILNDYADKIICCINGHTHNNLAEYIDGILYISTACAGQYELNDGSTRTKGTVDATAYDIFVVDRERQKIHCIRYGNGEDRELQYKINTDVNLIPTSINTDGTVYNEIGYKTGYRLNSSGNETSANGVTVTGFIACQSGDVVNLRSCGLSSTNTTSHYIAFYNSEFTMKKSTYPSKYIETYDNFDATVSDGVVTQFTIPTGISDVAYMRISSTGISGDSVIAIAEATSGVGEPP